MTEDNSTAAMANSRTAIELDELSKQLRQTVARFKV